MKKLVVLAVAWVSAALALGADVNADWKRDRPVSELKMRDGIGNFMAKLAAGKDVTVAYIGGSITCGDWSWRVKTTKWLREAYPKSKISEVHAAIGGTDSSLGVFRYDENVLAKNPDLVLIEFACNDSGLAIPTSRRSMEGMVRKTWRKDPMIDIAFAYVICNYMTNDYCRGVYPRAASVHEEIAENYGIPSVCFGVRVANLCKKGAIVMCAKELTPELRKESEGMKFPAEGDYEGQSGPTGAKPLFSVDGVHPTPDGQQLYANCMRDAFRAFEKRSGVNHASRLGEPMFDGSYECAKWFVVPRRALVGDGWASFAVPVGHEKDRVWSWMPEEKVAMFRTRRPGDAIKFSFRGTKCRIYALYGPDCAKLEIYVDGVRGKNANLFDMWSSRYRFQPVSVFEGADGVHDVEIRVSPEEPDRLKLGAPRMTPEVLADPMYHGTTFVISRVMLIGDMVDHQRQASFERGVVIPQPKDIKFHEGTVPTNVAVVSRMDASVEHEGYWLNVDKTGVSIVASDAAGVFYARQTLRQLAENGRWPCCTVVDAPHYRWRGMHLDESRHFFGKDIVKRFLDKAAEYKFNIFHWHLMDDQGCRLPLPKYPRMATIGASRPSPDYSRWILDTCEPGLYGPYVYSREDIREIVDYAARLHIAVLPEIEFPGHSREVLLAYPEFFCSDHAHLREAVTMFNARGTPLKYGAEPTLSCRSLCVGNDATLDFAKYLIDVVCELFPGDYIHIGGDECEKGNWSQCPRCRARMKAYGLKDEKELQSWAVRRIVDYVGKKGRKAIGWEEIAEGGLAEGVAVMSWLGPKAGIEAAVAGHDVVMATHTNCYFCYTQGISGDPYAGLPPGVKGNDLPLEQVYAFDPCAGVPEKARGHILGGQSFLWAEQVPNESYLQWKMWPRASAMSEVLWCGPRKRSFAEFKSKLDAVVRKLLAAGINVATGSSGSTDQVNER